MDLREFRELVVEEVVPTEYSAPVQSDASGDRRPEFVHYRDNGCEISPSCLRCPLPQCRYDDPGWLRRQIKGKRDQQVLKAREEEGLGPSELAERFGLSRRTIHRILKEHNGEYNGHGR